MNRFTKLIVFIAFFFCLGKSQAQSDVSFSEQANFSSYLINNSEYKDALYVLRQIKESLISADQLDSLNYLKGWSYYNMKAVDSSAVYLQKVSIASSFYHKSKFYSAFDIAYGKKYTEASALLESISLVSNDSSNSLQQLLNYEKSAMALLTRNYVAFDTLSKNFTYSYFPISIEEKGFVESYKKMKSFKDKSPLLAGVMSAVIPGSGKWYAGNKGQALAALFTVSAMAAATAESYIRGGYKSPSFIAFGSVFTIFYVGNIWGSVLSVKLRRDAFYKEMDRNIMLDMHIPLRRVFN